jgi:hypothetical protein
MATHQDESLLETLRLIGDLGEALATQVRRLERLSAELPGGPPSGMIGALAGDAERVKQRCDELRRRLGDSDPAEVVELSPRASKAEEDAATEVTAAATGDAVHTLAIEMRMEGRTRDEVEEYLARSFGRNDAARIADEAFHSQGPGAPPD